MNQQFSTPHKHMPGLTEPENRMDFAKHFPATYEIASWGWSSDKGKLRILRQIAETYGRDPRMREFVIHNVVGGMSRNFEGQARAILRWVQANIQYFNEPGEQVQAPWYTMNKGFGDCDDMAVLMASMAESIALPWRMALAGKGFGGRKVKYHEGGRMPLLGSFSHIYVQFGWPPFAPPNEQTWMSAEPTIPNAPLGYDVVDHGMSIGPGGRVDVPAAFQGSAGSHPGPGPYGGYIVGREGYDGYGRVPVYYGQADLPDASVAPAPVPAVPVPAPTNGIDPAQPFGGVFQKLDWSEIIAAAVQGVIVAGAVALATPYIIKRSK